MPQITIAYGTLLMLLGIGGYVLSGMASITALIPLVFGVPIEMCGWIASAKSGARKHAMHAAAGLALLGLLGSAPGLVKMLGGTMTMATKAQALMATLSAIYLALAIRSFVEARLKR